MFTSNSLIHLTPGMLCHETVIQEINVEFKRVGGCLCVCMCVHVHTLQMCCDAWIWSMWSDKCLKLYNKHFPHCCQYCDWMYTLVFSTKRSPKMWGRRVNCCLSFLTWPVIGPDHIRKLIFHIDITQLRECVARCFTKYACVFPPA